MNTNQSAPDIKFTDRKVVILPIGSCEQHGPYLPIDTDLKIAQLIAEKITNLFTYSEALLLPAIPFSCSWEHKGLGTIALNTSTIAAIVHDIARSLKIWNMPILLVLLNWHGGNSLLGSLTAEITASEEIPTAVIHAIGQAGIIWNTEHKSNVVDIHAGAIETSIIQAYWPKLIHDEIPETAHYEPDIPYALTQASMQALNIRTITKEGIWGAPENANPDKGKSVIETLVKDIYQEIIQLLNLVNTSEKLGVHI